MDFSIFIFLSVLMVAIGYIASNSRDFNFWKIALLGLILIPLFEQFGFSKPHLATIVAAFVVGYLLPHAHALEGFSDAISNLINAIRYKDAYDDIRRKEAEVEELRRQYEQARREANQERQEQERQRREQESKHYRKSQQKRERKSSSHQESGKQHRQQQSNQKSSTQESTRQRYLRILGLDPNGNYSFKEIKKAYRRQASKYHPDKHHYRGDTVWKEMNEKYRLIKEAFEALAVGAT